jgi:hypothetical protein
MPEPANNIGPAEIVVFRHAGGAVAVPDDSRRVRAALSIEGCETPLDAWASIVGTSIVLELESGVRWTLALDPGAASYVARGLAHGRPAAARDR